MRVGQRAAIMCAVVLVVGGIMRGQAQQNTPPEPAGQTPGAEQKQDQGIPDAPGEVKPGETKTDENPNPVQQVEDRTKQAAVMTQHAAKVGLLKARDWESGWITGVYVARDRPLVTLTGRERTEYYLRQTLTTPSAYMKRMFAAGIDQTSGSPRQWDDGWGGYAERFASREGQFITANTLAALGNAKLGYEVRYDKCKCDGAWPRSRHAILRNFLTYDRSEQHFRPQLALYGGALGGGLVSTTWKPGSQSYWKNGVWGIVGQAGYGALVNFFTEFSKEINRKQGVNKIGSE